MSRRKPTEATRQAAQDRRWLAELDRRIAAHRAAVDAIDVRCERLFAKIDRPLFRRRTAERRAA